jgi:formylglycine-generating enzyme required for sulfatase activity/tRNA A-37 threonylcarbamoyl transferase component Bud32
VHDEIASLNAALAARYRVEREIGRGGMATVYLAGDLKHERRVALKVLRPELAAALGTERFLREIKLTARLSHPHILPLLDSGDAAGRLYYVMPYVEGESLRRKLEREGPLSLEETVSITRGVASALDYAHRHGVLHRDIKPENILLHEGEAIVADFGIALAISAAGGERLTGTGLSVGTPAYMSPEQIRGEREPDVRSDLYSLACVTYEMLAGEPPFSGPSVEAIIARRLTEPAPHVAAARRSLPETVDRTLAAALSEAPERRFPSGAAFTAALAPPSPEPPGTLPAARALLRRPAIILAALAVALLLAAAVIAPQRARAARERARQMVPEIERLAAAGRDRDAYQLAVTAERRLGADSTLARLLLVTSDLLSVTTTPEGASVYLQPFAPDTAGRLPDSVAAGVTPIRDLRLARADYRVVMSLPGRATVERLASTAFERSLTLTPRQPFVAAVTAHLLPLDSAPRDMVFVPGATYQLASPDAPAGISADLDDYYIDRYEVTNEAYREFVAAGGYTRRDYWASLVARPGPPGAWEEAMHDLTDRTGLPGPRRWVGQEFPSGTGRHPVTGVTWHEAAAFCAFAGKRLPTVFQWEKAARDGVTHPLGIMMPWGYVDPGEPSRLRARFSSSGTTPVDAYPFGISAYGAHAMAGNVKEWMLNEMGDGHAVTGGSWEDPMYLYSEYGSFSGLYAAPTLGFRCARTASPTSRDQGAGPIRFDRRTPTYTPVDERGFRSLLTHYRYDPRPLSPRIVETHETADWVRETIWYAGVAGDSVLAYLYLPRRASAPFQAMVYVASTGAFYQHTVPEELEWLLASCIRAGRAAFGVVFKGMVQRGRGPGYRPPPPASVEFRDVMVLHATELRLGLDYLETRPDIDADRLAYVGLSWGAGSRLVLAGVDARFRSVILIGGGIDERVHPTLPEASNINFAPYIRAPKLLLNGRYDEEHPYHTRALPLWNLLREPKRLVLVDSAGHVPPQEALVPAVNQWLDETMGPVRAGAGAPRSGGQRQP